MTSASRNLEVHVSSGDRLDVRQFAVEQRISALFEITALALSENPNIDFDAVAGQPASFSMDNGVGGPDSARTWTGICKHIEQLAVEDTGLSTYRITIVPTLWLATQRSNHRIFQQVSELDIARKILAEWGVAPELRISGTHRKRKYRVQYGESDFAFVSRMLEEAGISFYFAQGDAGTKLVLSDAPQSNERRASAVSFKDRPTAMDREFVTKLHVGRTVQPGRATLRDHDTRLPASYKLVATAEAPDAGVEGRLEQFQYAPGAFQFGTDQGEPTPFADDKGRSRSDEKEGAALAKKRLDATRSGAKTCTFETNAADLAPGVVMSIVDHPRSDVAGGTPLLVVASSHSGKHDGDWTHRCEARRADAPFRPPLVTPRPKISGVESATVVGPPGEEIHTDEFGRVRVHFHWDRESRMDDNSSCWIHVSQPWGGAGYGATNLPRIGQEVLVDFLGGDPDRPVITGRIYTNLQKTPYKLPDNKTQSGWKSNSTKGTGGYNEIMFEDAAGRELVRMQAEKDLHKLVKNDEQVTIGHDREKLVKNDDSLTVGNDRTKVVQNDEAVTIGNNRTKLVKNDETVTIGNDRTRRVENDDELTVGNNRTKQVQNNEREVVGTSRTRMVGVNESVAIGVEQNVAVGGAQTIEVGAVQSVAVGGAQLVTVGGAQTTTVGAAHALTVALASAENVGLVKSLAVGDAYQITVGGAMSTTVQGAQTEQVGAGKTVKVADKIEFVCGKAKMVFEKSGKITWAIDGGATIVLDDKNVLITAGGGGTVVITGGPDVHVNPP
jgi:type VI secretion system secreted protein VgrG